MITGKHQQPKKQPPSSTWTSTWTSRSTSFAPDLELGFAEDQVLLPNAESDSRRWEAAALPR